MPRRKNKLNKNTPQLINIVFTGILSKIKNRWKRNLLFFRKKYFQESGQLGYDGSRGMSSQNFRRAQGAKRKRGSCTADTDFIKMVAFIIYLFFFLPIITFRYVTQRHRTVFQTNCTNHIVLLSAIKCGTKARQQAYT